MRAPLSMLARRDVLAGLIFILIAAGFFAEGMRYDFGTPLSMGPGFIPLVLAGMLASFGMATIFLGLRNAEPVDKGRVPLVSFVLISSAFIVFALAGRQLGLVPTVALCTFMAALASPANSSRAAAGLAVVMAIVCYLVFKIGLGVSLPTIGPAFRF